MSIVRARDDSCNNACAGKARSRGTRCSGWIAGFTLFDNADNDRDVQALTDGAALAALASEQLNIRAEVTSGAAIGSVCMGGQAFPAGTYTVQRT